MPTPTPPTSPGAPPPADTPPNAPPALPPVVPEALDEGPRGPAASPGRLAFRAFLRHRLAVLGASIVAIMSLIVVFGPMVWPHDPNLQRVWLRELPPLSSAPDALSRNVLAPGQPLEGPDTWRAGTQLEVDRTISDSDKVRLNLRRGVLHTLMIEEGANYLDGLDLRPEAGIQEAHVLLPDDSLGVSVSGLQLTKGAAPPPDLFPAGERVVYLLVTRTARHETLTASLAPDGSGTVHTLLLDGSPHDAKTELRGDSITAVRLDGQPIALHYYLGSDELGRDLAARVMAGGRISLLVGLVATIVSLIIGVFYGAVSGYAGGRLDRLMMGAVDVLYAIPFMFVVILLLAFFNSNLIMLFVALGAVQWLTMARIVRGQILSLKEQEFIEAARLSGCGPFTIILRHLIPHTIGPVVVYTSLTVPAVILEESFLSFIGLSVTWNGTSIDSWGLLVANGISTLGEGGQRAWLILVPAIALSATLFGLNALGDGLRDAFDPKSSKH